jgi:hypothetical protein
MLTRLVSLDRVLDVDAVPAGTAWPGVDATVVEALLVLDAIALPATRRSLLPWRRLAR